MGERRALLIGVQNDRFGRLDFVPEVVKDLRAVVLDTQYGACRPALPDGRELLIESEATTRAKIVEALGDAVASAGRDQATLFVYFLGHGHKEDEDFYLVASDTPGRNRIDAENAVPLGQRIKELLRQYPGVDGLMLVIDACHSGAVISDPVPGLLRQGLQARVEFFAATRPEEAASRGCFSRSLIELLKRGSPHTADAQLRAYDEHAQLREVAPADCADLAPTTHASLNGSRDAGLWLGLNHAADLRPALAGTQMAGVVARLTRNWQMRPGPAADVIRLLATGTSPIAITGGPGTGKSALLASFGRRSAGDDLGMDALVTARLGDNLADLAAALLEQLNKSPTYRKAAERFQKATPVREQANQPRFDQVVTGPLAHLDPEDEDVLIGVDTIEQLDTVQRRRLLEAFTNLHGAALIVTGRNVDDLPAASQVPLPDRDPEGVQRLVRALVEDPVARDRIASLSDGEWLRARILSGLHRAGHFAGTQPHRTLDLAPVFEKAVSAAMATAPQAPVEDVAKVLAAAPVGAQMPLQVLVAALWPEDRADQTLGVRVRDGLVALGELLVRADAGSPDERVGPAHELIADFLRGRFGEDVVADAHSAIVQALADLQLADPGSKPVAAYARNRLSEHLWAVGQSDPALTALPELPTPADNLALWQSWHERLLQRLGPDHPSTLTTRAKIALWTGRAGNARAALALFTALLPDRERVLGPDHPDTLATRHSIAFWTGRAGEADEIRTLVAAGDYLQAQQRLMRLATEDPQQAEPLRLELGFITLPDPDRRLVATAWSAIAVGRTVGSLLARDDDASPAHSSPGTPETPDTAEVTTSLVTEAAPVRQQAPAVTTPRRSSQQSGAALEEATVDLFARFFAVDPDAILRRLRRQGAGTQFGHDIELECTVAGSPAVRCHVECKNLDRRVTVDDIAGKLAQQKYHHRGAQIDHWILISPHHNGANDLPGMLDAWDRQGEYPFAVQVWSPETRVRELFALEPAVYEAVYGRPPTQEEVNASAEVAELIKQRLAPRLRIDAVWRRYLEQPGAFCFVNEDSRHFDGLYGRHLPLKAADEPGALLDGTLMEQVIGWASGGGSAPMLLLADFGEGKSVFTYCLTRRLAEEFRAAPDGALFPLRIPLREFREAGSARGLLERRLNEIGATLARWRTLTEQVPTLAILDGLDEMSADLSPDAITTNLKDIRSCLTELSGSKVLVTSRQRVLDGSRDWKRTLDRLGQPQVVRIASGPRRQRVKYLEQFATDEASARVLANLRSLYDPIGLAAKPLFLEMIKETLRDLPDYTFSETILYDTYINKSLRTKWELLADPDEELTSDELTENLKEILEDIAVRLQEINGAYLYLHDYQGKDRGKIAELLWKMRDQGVPRDSFSLAAQDDAANRVGIRSLLKAVPAPDADRWPVDFFHRSMREYFVARLIARSLTTDAKRTRQILSTAPLLPEIAHFAATILRSRQDDAALAALEKLARSATTDRGAYLGGNALTLLYGAGGRLAEQDWTGLRLDHARLRGADLRGARLAGSSLRYANLDNANLQDVDLTGADLEGVRLEETSQVLGVTVLGGNRVIAAYEDRSLREWRGRPGAGWESQVVATLNHNADQLQVTPLGRVLASGEGMVSVLEVAANADDFGESVESGGSASSGASDKASSVRCAFRTSSRCRAAVLGARTALFTEEGAGGQLLITWLDMDTVQALNELDVDETVTAWAQLDEVLFAHATSNGIHVVWPLGEANHEPVIVADPGVTCLAVRANDDGALLAAGHQDGSVSLTQLSPADTGVVAPQYMRHLHDGPVTDILLDAEEQVITGSTDRSVCVTLVSAVRSDSPASDEAESAVQRLHLTLRCKGVRFDGVRTEREQEKLRRYAES